METVRLPFNYYAAAHLRKFELRTGLPAVLSQPFEAEIGKPIRAVYLGIYDSPGNLAGVARVVPQSLDAVILDAMYVLPEHPRREAIETRLLESAGRLAADGGRSLSVLADREALPHWTSLGFQPDRRTLLTLSAA